MDFYLIKHNIIKNEIKNPLVSIIGIPFDSTSIEFPGQRFAPKAIRETLLHLYGLDLDTNLNIYDIFEDLGDINITHGDFKETENTISKFIDAFKDQRQTTPLFLGGEHSITYATLKALSKHKKIDLIVFDAHTDLFDTYNGEKISHISYLRKLIDEKIINKVLVFGAREISKEEQEFIRNNPKHIQVSKQFNKKDLSFVSKNVYLSIDLDVLDYDIAIATSTPEVDGYKLKELFAYIKEVIKEKNIEALDIVELNPMLECARITKYASAFLLKEILLNLAFYQDKN